MWCLLGAVSNGWTCPVVVREDQSWLNTWGPGVLGTLLSGLILYGLFVLTERRADRRAELERDRRAQADREDRERQAASDRHDRQREAVVQFIEGIQVAEVAFTSGRRARGPGAVIETYQAEVARLTAGLSARLWADSPDVAAWLSGVSGEAAEATVHGRTGKFERHTADLTVNILDWLTAGMPDEWPSTSIFVE